MKNIYQLICVMLLSLVFIQCSNKPEQPAPAPNPLDKLVGSYRCTDSFYTQTIKISSEGAPDRYDTLQYSFISDIKIVKVSETRFLVTQENDFYSRDPILYNGALYSVPLKTLYRSGFSGIREIQFFPDQDSISLKEDIRYQYYLNLKPENNDLVYVHSLRFAFGKKM